MPETSVHFQTHNGQGLPGKNGNIPGRLGSGTDEAVHTPGRVILIQLDINSHGLT